VLTSPPSSLFSVDGFYVAKFKVSRMPKKTRAALEAEAVDAEPAEEEFVPLPTSIEEEEKTEKIRKAEEDANKAVKFDDDADAELIEGESFFLFSSTRLDFLPLRSSLTRFPASLFFARSSSRLETSSTQGQGNQGPHSAPGREEEG